MSVAVKDILKANASVKAVVRRIYMNTDRVPSGNVKGRKLKTRALPFVEVDTDSSEVFNVKGAVASQVADSVFIRCYAQDFTKAWDIAETVNTALERTTSGNVKTILWLDRRMESDDLDGVLTPYVELEYKVYETQ